MRSRLASALAVAALFLGTVSSDGQAPQRQAGGVRSRVDAAVPFRIGETLTYDVSWSSLIMAGTASATVRERRPVGDSTAYYMVAEGRPIPLVARLYPLYYKMDTLLDNFTLLAHQGTWYAEERNDKRTATTRFDRARNRVSFEANGGGAATTEYAVPPTAQDGVATFYLLRARGVSAGERFTIPVADSGALFNAQFEVAGVEEVRVPLGTLPAWQIRVALTDAQGQAVWKNTVLWMTNDGRRLPIKLQAELPVGHFVLALKSVQ
jgi:hypothetical protein